MSQQQLSLVFGFLAATLWLLSAFTSVWAMRAKLDLGSGPATGDGVGVRVSASVDGEGEVIVNGIRVPSFGALSRYQQAVSYRNAIAAALNGSAALSALAAAYFALFAA